MARDVVLRWLTGTSKLHKTARELYGAVVTAARAPELYVEHGVPDTPEGRYELIVLHLALVMERLAAGADGRALAQRLAETFVTDMDDNMREMGVGDLAVPRKVKRAAAALYERAARWHQALAADAPEAALPALVGELLLPDAAAGASGRLAAHIRETAAAVAGLPVGELLAGRVRFAR